MGSEQANWNQAAKKGGIPGPPTGGGSGLGLAKVLVLYYSRSGNTRSMAEAVAEGVQAGGAEASLRSVQDTTPDQLLEYQGIILGSPTYYGVVSGQIKSFFDESVKLHGKLSGRVGGAFASCGIMGGGSESTVLSLVQMLLVHGMVVPGFAMTSHYGPVAVGKPDDTALKNCRSLGQEVARLAQILHDA